jgi:hypothetical protein
MNDSDYDLSGATTIFITSSIEFLGFVEPENGSNFNLDDFEM